MNIAPSPSVSIITVLWKQASTSPGWFLRPEIPWFSPSLLNSLFPHAKTFPASVKKKVPSLPHDTEAMVAPLGISTWKNQRIESTFEINSYKYYHLYHILYLTSSWQTVTDMPEQGATSYLHRGGEVILTFQAETPCGGKIKQFWLGTQSMTVH